MDKVALVTGATSGIGRATALAFAKRGDGVAVVGRREQLGLQLEQELKTFGVKALYIKADTSTPDSAESIVNKVIEEFGALHYVFNNAGITGEMALVTEQSAENFERVFNLNVRSILLGMKYQIPQIIKSGGGAIVNTASVAASGGMPTASVYGASKAAVVSLTQTAALENAASGVTVNAISPGGIRTETFDEFWGGDEEAINEFAKAHPVQRLGRPEEIAHIVLSLCHEGASFLTGKAIEVDGGIATKI